MNELAKRYMRWIPFLDDGPFLCILPCLFISIRHRPEWWDGMYASDATLNSIKQKKTKAIIDFPNRMNIIHSLTTTKLAAKLYERTYNKV